MFLLWLLWHIISLCHKKMTDVECTVCFISYLMFSPRTCLQQYKSYWTIESFVFLFYFSLRHTGQTHWAHFIITLAIMKMKHIFNESCIYYLWTIYYVLESEHYPVSCTTVHSPNQRLGEWLRFRFVNNIHIIDWYKPLLVSQLTIVLIISHKHVF